jgi:uncharacterized membrane protein YfcA
MFSTVWIFAYIVIGLCAGFVAGLFGIGGGTIMVPLLAMLFEAQQFPADHVLHLALGTSMAAIIFTAISSARAHDKHGAVIWPVVMRIVPGILLGTMIGTLLAAHISSRGLAIFFACFILYIALQMFVSFKPKPSRELPLTAGIIAAGTLIGGLSSLVAIGGGILTVPFLTWCNVRMQDAIGTSAAVGIPIAVGGSLGYIWNGMHASGLPAGSLGFVYLPALLFVMSASILTAPLGARLAHRLPVQSLKRLFAALLVALAAKMLHGLFWKT